MPKGHGRKKIDLPQREPLKPTLNSMHFIFLNVYKWLGDTKKLKKVRKLAPVESQSHQTFRPCLTYIHMVVKKQRKIMSNKHSHMLNMS